MNTNIQIISDRLSLREPQKESLEILAKLLDAITLSKHADPQESLTAIQELFPSVTDFERKFPSLCFNLATGVGKTRLMGAFIAYLYLAKGIRHFFILAPNLTIYEKLKQDFIPNSPKYVLPGLHEFIKNTPAIITGENYDKAARFDEADFTGQGDLWINDRTPIINIFNISKINAVENKAGAQKSTLPRVKRLSETLGKSYFDYLSNLEDLVIIMDEAHRYRASAGAAAINELKPVLGLELTATPKTIGAKANTFKNIVYNYSLAEALEDGFVKDPAVATRKDFQPEKYTVEELEQIKLEDAVHAHESVKTQLQLYAAQYEKELIKPFILVVAADTTHAKNLHEKIESDAFFEGRYKGKVAEVHSKQSGAETDETVQKLIDIEKPHEVTEIIIHVNKLKEGWDVTNLYTIVPLRASASDILTEQTLGRGLRLPYGKRTGIESIDSLTIIAHDQFQKIVDQAKSPNSLITKTVYIGEGGDIPAEPDQIISNPTIVTALFTENSPSAATSADPQADPASFGAEYTQEEKAFAEKVLEVIQEFKHLPSLKALHSPEIEKNIIKKVNERLAPNQKQLDFAPKEQKDREREWHFALAREVIQQIISRTIDIPKITLTPDDEVSYGFNDFDLEGLETINYQPLNEELIIRNLQTAENRFLTTNGTYAKEPHLENYILREFLNILYVDYDRNGVLLRKLAAQIVARCRSYLSNDEDVEKVLVANAKAFADFIHVQLKKHVWRTPTAYTAKVNAGFTPLKTSAYTLPAGAKPQDFRKIPKEKHKIKQLVFTGFQKCCYLFQKFDSVDGELRFAHILEDDRHVLLWVKPASNSFIIDYDHGQNYQPDFVVETEGAKYICEIKRADEINDVEVQAKARAAVEWCGHASEHAAQHEDKPWHYVLIPHNAIAANCSFDGLVNKFIRCPKVLSPLTASNMAVTPSARALGGGLQ